ncbi:nitrate/sulfonate/bicarbonate ABC transporter ATP-binding protein [Candidatus Synchoanobacter obligatus]|uniref:Nitrate/sulfonate/bicarbonate ABC transporter ATP-binding protein n=1 Tax=Candidatus Synchoanobacter obligatus TaxID=2919597 RepID=A0ABT1L513_9GAMM|nr:nitrate/sulfonate/bicarbonate ABC transporter ATP-binding protein [Candidatus Synchoanobacter obligatus]MCP8352269.1 nitrate/sulfonate/bicarbonate ABC transporter ATP-binding protein [Candidatus Synchoanobacter obligatus]
MAGPILEIKDVKKSFHRGSQSEILVLDDISLSLNEGEVVCLLGKSGSGKSTLLRIIAGLIQPSNGFRYYKQQPAFGGVKNLSMVFQHFALLPWMSVLENVELGLESSGMSTTDRRDKALKAIDMVGLDGFESAYPKELSGGIAQRVGLARALVVDPEIMLLDEPFSALDILTAENLRGDLINLWTSKKTNLKSMLIVTHNIEEAVYMADRILIFGSDPGKVKSEMRIDLAHPRDDKDEEMAELVDQVYQTIAEVNFQAKRAGMRFRTIRLGHMLPSVPVSNITGLLEFLVSGDGSEHAELSEVAEEMHLGLDEILPVAEAVEILRFATVSGGRFQLTPTGDGFAKASILDQKKLFARQLLDHVPVAVYVRGTLENVENHTMHESELLGVLQEKMSEVASRRVLRTIVDWGRYAELFAYNVNSGVLSLEDP